MQRNFFSRNGAWQFTLPILLLLAPLVAWAQTDGETAPVVEETDGPIYDENVEGDMVLLLQDLAAECRARQARGEDYTEQLSMMNGLVYKGELVARNYAEFIENFLPEITDADLRAQSIANLSRAYTRFQDFEQSDRVMEELIAEYPDPTTEWGRKSRYIQAINDIQLKRYDAAVRRLEELWGVADQFDEKNFRQVGMQLADILYRQEDWEGVLRVGLAAVPPEIDENGVSVYAYEKIALSYQNLGDFENAKLYFQRILDFLEELQSRDPDNPLLDKWLFTSAERGLQLAEMGLQTAEYRRQGEESRAESERLGAAIEATVEGLLKNMDKPTSNLEPARVAPIQAAVPMPPMEEAARHSYTGMVAWALFAVLGLGALGVTVLHYRRQARVKNAPSRSRPT
jgi:tetratricopeptide (TPR) repeat protein